MIKKPSGMSRKAVGKVYGVTKALRAAQAQAEASNARQLGVMEILNAASGEGLLDAARRVAVERDGWRHVAEYFLGEAVNQMTPDEARDAAIQRSISEGWEDSARTAVCEAAVSWLIASATCSDVEIEKAARALTEALAGIMIKADA